MEDNLRGLRELCEEDLSGQSPFQVRTRFERYLYGVMVEYSMKTFGSAPNGLSSAHLKCFTDEKIAEARERFTSCESCIQMFGMISELYEEFTRLCDTSNWTDDGQDPRVNWCRDDILQLCDFVSEQFQPDVFRHPRSDRE
jgi:hypothetical protein